MGKNAQGQHAGSNHAKKANKKKNTFTTFLKEIQNPTKPVDQLHENG